MPTRFEDILPTARGSDDAFEELVCQLARRHPPDVAVEFRRIHGPGGDGGIESYWVLPDGSEVGYQAKYYLASGSIRWDALDDSVTTALSLHPRLVRYVVAIACDFTDRTARRGTSGWEKWEQHKASWEAEARRVLGHDVVFEPWPASRLREMLEQPTMSGLHARWFGSLPLTPAWLAERARQAVADLGERYHADDHVSVECERLFEVLLRTGGFRQRLKDRLQRIRDGSSHLVGTGAWSDEAASARRAVDAVLAVGDHIDAESWTPWAATRWSGLAKTAQGAVSVLSTNLRDQWRGQEGPARQYTPALAAEQDALARMTSDLASLDRLWIGTESDAEHKRVVLLTGRGGSGKSHLLARQAESAAAEGRPVVLVLGQQLGAQAMWPQILERLGVDGTADRFLQALDSTAEAANMRALLIVDALNEGAGASARRNELASFVATVAPYRNIACVLSCRSEYVRYVVPRGLLEAMPQVTVRGFVSPEEQRRAALVFMDRKGIARPRSPWLSEEFTNPLFLRSVCVALAVEGKREFPLGLVGLKRILAFYVDSVARHLVAAYEGSDDLVGPTYATLLGVASAMATERRDYLSRRQADMIAAQRFEGFARPGSETWLEVLQRSGLLRFDPDPEVDLDVEGTAFPGHDVVRFSFQRFQDQLIADALLQGVADIQGVLAPGGRLHFLSVPGEREAWGAGVLGALAVQVPEKHRRELVDVMPGGLEDWRASEEMATAFAESIRLRAPDAFSARTTELFETWMPGGAASVSTLFEVSTIAGHPWNAEAMHRRLASVSMPERDTRWTVALNGMERRSKSHRFYALCDWCAGPDVRTAPDRTRELAALGLAWCLTSSNRRVRDEATKALTHLMLAQSGVMTYLVEKLQDVDDNYVSERLWAAALGACTHDPGPQRLGSYARLAWRAVFSKASVPRELLLRDYARAIVELAVIAGCEIDGIDLDRCRPPYGDPPLALAEVPPIDNEFASGLSDGAQRIVSSCGELSDFGSYCIKPALHQVTTIGLVALPVATKESAFRSFRTRVLDGHEDRTDAFRMLEEHLRSMRMPRLEHRDEGLEFRLHEPTARQVEQAEALREALSSMLDEAETEAFERDGEPWLLDSFTPPTERVDTKKCQSWVARRAIEMGGAAVDEGNLFASGSERPIVERLGKKYQWLALSELLCHLTSNLALEVGYHEDRTHRAYDVPPDVGLVRDIDPTVLAYAPPTAASPADAWMFGPRIVLDEVSEQDLGAWPARADPAGHLDRQVVRTAPDGRRWFTLYDHAHVTDKYADRAADHGMRQQEFRRIFTVLVENARLEAFVADIARREDLSVSDWEVPQLTDGPYLGEAGWRATWPQEQWSERGIPAPRSIRQAFPLYDYRWESHLDVALPEGASAYVPAAWLTRMLGLKLSPGRTASVLDSSGSVAIIHKVSDQGHAVLLQEDQMTRLGLEFGLSCAWLLVAERNAWPGGTNAFGTWRRSEGVAWIESGQVACRTWFRDGSAA